MSFDEQLLPGEEIIILARQHPLVLSRPVFFNVFALALLAGFAWYCQIAWLLLFYLIPLIYFLWKLLAWRKQEYILTNRRVVKQEGVFSSSSFDAPLDKINNVYHQQSFMGRLLKYGEVGLETASEQGTTVFNFLMNPIAFKNAIVQQRELYTDSSRPAGSERKSIPQLIDELASLRDRKIITESEFQEKKRSLLEKM
jgi:uncharacterized membrane protein YdbT with pleckstrin-like domain